jgi:acyl-CoA synthetase (NDP forming)
VTDTVQRSGFIPPAPMPAPASLASMFAPNGIAIVGASDRSGWSRYTYANLVQGGYPYRIHLVNRRGAAVHGQPAIQSLEQLDEPVDLAYVLTGPDSLPEVMRDAAASGIGNLVVIAAGFGEMGAEGQQRERELARSAAELGLCLLGPNNLGYINTAAATMPWSQMLPWPMEAGGVGILSQSGALGIFLLNYLQSRDVGISHLITLGNEAMITVAEGIDYLVDQEQTKVIALYLESVRHPDVFIAAASRALEAGKPIVAYKAGRGALGAKVTAAHTGSLAGDDRVIDALFRQHGIIRVDTVEDLVTTCGLFDGYGEISGRGVAFVTGSGAMCGVIGDTAEEHGLSLPDFAPQTVNELRARGLPDFATAQNPLDTTGYVVIDPDLLSMSEEVVSRDPGIGILVVNGSVPGTEQAAEFMRNTIARRQTLFQNSPVPVISMEFLPGDRTPYARAFRRSSGMPHVVDSFTRGIPALARLMSWSDRRQRGTTSPSRSRVALPGGERAGVWTERKVGEFLAQTGVPVVPTRLVRSADEAAQAARSLGYPVAMKVSSVDIVHKTDAGGVVLGIATAEAARRAYDDMLARVGQTHPEAFIEGAILSPMRADGVDLLVGIVRDEVWGLTLVVGAGGIWVEVLRDSALRVLPVDPAEVRSMLQELASFSLLTGARGTEAADLDRVVEVISRIADVAYALDDEVEELEINPLRVRGSQVEVLDALVRWREGVSSEADGVSSQPDGGAR